MNADVLIDLVRAVSWPVALVVIAFLLRRRSA